MIGITFPAGMAAVSCHHQGVPWVYEGKSGTAYHSIKPSSAVNTKLCLINTRLTKNAISFVHGQTCQVLFCFHSALSEEVHVFREAEGCRKL